MSPLEWERPSTEQEQSLHGLETAALGSVQVSRKLSQGIHQQRISFWSAL